MKKLAILVAVLAISAGVLVGCGGSAATGPAVTKEIKTDDSFKFSPNTIDANKNDNLTINVTGSAMLHDFNIDALNVHQTIEAGKTVAVKIPTDKAGTYAFYCNQPGHKDTMNGTLTIK